MADASLWPIVLTGFFTLAGSLGAMGIGSFVTSRRDKEQERRDDRKRRADKFEEMVAAVYAFDEWLYSIQQRDAFGTDHIQETVPPFAKLQSISAVYFPQFDGSIRELDQASGQVRLWIDKAKQKRLSNNITQLCDGFEEVRRPYVQKREALLDALNEFAHEEFQPASK
jgi:hypothetical protein